MNKAELVEQVATKTGATKQQADELLTAVLETVIETVAQGHPVKLLGFGSFGVSDRKERKGRNPKTGKEMAIPAAQVPKVTAGNKFRAAIAHGKD